MNEVLDYFFFLLFFPYLHFYFRSINLYFFLAFYIYFVVVWWRYWRHLR